MSRCNSLHVTDMITCALLHQKCWQLFSCDAAWYLDIIVLGDQDEHQNIMMINTNDFVQDNAVQRGTTTKLVIEMLDETCANQIPCHQITGHAEPNSISLYPTFITTCKQLGFKPFMQLGYP